MPQLISKRPANDNNRTIWTGAFRWRYHWHLALAGLLFGIAFSSGCGMVVKGYWPFMH